MGYKQNLLKCYWYSFQGIEPRNFSKLGHNDCLFTHVYGVVLLWVDDCMIYSKDSKNIDSVIDGMDDGFMLDRE